MKCNPTGQQEQKETQEVKSKADSMKCNTKLKNNYRTTSSTIDVATKLHILLSVYNTFMYQNYPKDYNTHRMVHHQCITKPARVYPQWKVPKIFRASQQYSDQKKTGRVTVRVPVNLQSFWIYMCS
jgi:hypothetical protein